MYIFRWVASSEIDMKSIEMLSRVRLNSVYKLRIGVILKEIKAQIAVLEKVHGRIS